VPPVRQRRTSQGPEVFLLVTDDPINANAKRQRWPPLVSRRDRSSRKSSVERRCASSAATCNSSARRSARCSTTLPYLRRGNELSTGRFDANDPEQLARVLDERISSWRKLGCAGAAELSSSWITSISRTRVRSSKIMVRFAEVQLSSQTPASPCKEPDEDDHRTTVTASWTGRRLRNRNRSHALSAATRNATRKIAKYAMIVRVDVIAYHGQRPA
jgi:hypothetical protein